LSVSCESTAFSTELGVHTLAEAVRRVSAALKQSPQQLLAPLSRMFASFSANNFAVLNALFQSVGAGVYPHAALLNHSCSPNSLLTYVLRPGKPPMLRCVALAAMCAGQEITHCYADASQPTAQRHLTLRQGYGFECQCPCCVGGHPASSCGDVSPVAKALQAMAAVPDPLWVRDLLAALPPAQLAALQGVVDLLQGDSEQAAHPPEVLGLLADISAQPALLRADGAAARSGAPHALLARLRTVDGQFHRLMQALGPFHATTYSRSAALFNELLAETLLLQPLCGSGGALYEAFVACKQLTIALCGHVCAYLTLTLRCFPFHPLLGLQVLTLGQLSQQPPLLAWAVQILSECNGPEPAAAQRTQEGCLAEVLRVARAELARHS